MSDLEFERLNELADHYDLSPFDQRMRHYMMRSLKPWLKAGAALEVGCMHGEFTQLLAALYADLTVVEPASQFIANTRARVGAQAQFIQSLFETFATERRFDAIFLLHVLEHLEDPVSALKKAGQLLAPQGRIFIVVPNGNAPSRQLAVKMGLLRDRLDLSPADLKHGHRRVYLSDTLERDARSAGLSILHRGGIFFKPLANFQLDALIGGPLISEEFMEACYALGMEYPSLCASIFLVCEAHDLSA